MLHADGEVAEAEAAILEAARVECTVDGEPADASIDEILDRAPGVLDSPGARNAFLLARIVQ